MKNAIVRALAFTRLALRPAVIISISLAMFLFAACETDAPSGQRDSNTLTGPRSLNGSLSKGASVSTSAVLLGAASTFAVLGGTTVTNDGPSLITGDLGVSHGTAITGFQQPPANTIMGPGTVTGGAGMGLVTGTIYAGGPLTAQAHIDAALAYNYLVTQVPTMIFSGVTELSGLTLTPGVYKFAPSANLAENGTLTLDFQGNSDALFIFQTGTTLVMNAGSSVIANNNPGQTCPGSNVYWAVGSSATINGTQFLGTVIATTIISMTYGANVSGRVLALNGQVTMNTDNISVCGSSGGGTVPPESSADFVTGGGWINDKATFGLSGGIKNDKFWGQLSYDDHGKNGVTVKSWAVTAYIVIDPVTRQIEGVAKVNANSSFFTYKVVVVDNGDPGRNDWFSLELGNGYSASGTLKSGNIQLHK